MLLRRCALFGLAGLLAFGCAEVGTSALGGFTSSGTGGGGTTGNATSGTTTGPSGPTGSGPTGSGPTGTTSTGSTTTTSGTSSGSGAGTTTTTASASGTTTTSTGASGASSTGASSTGAGGASSTGAGGASNGGSGAGGTYNTPPTCSSMTMALGGNNANMKPGSACRTCHVLGGAASGKTFDVAGTVYLTAHEPDDCNGVGVSGANVVITDGNGVDTPLPVNAVGNFYHYDLFGIAAFKPPMKARVEYNGQVRKMLTAITNGDCDSCHTETGTMSAPGRIMLP